MPDLVQLTYSSVATHPYTQQELDELLTQARTNNLAAGITGMLLYAEGSFFQVIEGPPEAIHALFEKIEHDSRHTRVTEIIHERIAHRDFADWTMGYTTLSEQEANAITGSNDFFHQGESFTHLKPGRAKKLLQAFKTGRWRHNLSDEALPQAAVGEVLDFIEQDNTKLKTTAPTRGNYTFAFQPIVNVATQKVFSYEALLRGTGHEPAKHVLKRIPESQMHQFDEEARILALKLAAHLGLSTHINLNFLPRSTQTSPTTIQSLLDVAQQHSINAEQIVIEILEREIISDYDAFYRVIDECRGSGVVFAIDDFGSGYAGLNLLAEFQPNLVKLDMHLIREIYHKGPRQAIVRGIQRTCEDLGIDIIAEGVESTEEYHWLRNEGVFLFQGNLLSSPGFEYLPQAITIPQ